MGKVEFSNCYERGLTKQGPGAIIIPKVGVWHYEPLKKLERFRDQQIEAPAPWEKIQYKSRRFLDLVHEVKPIQNSKLKVQK